MVLGFFLVRTAHATFLHLSGLDPESRGCWLAGGTDKNTDFCLYCGATRCNIPQVLGHNHACSRLRIFLKPRVKAFAFGAVSIESGWMK